MFAGPAPSVTAYTVSPEARLDILEIEDDNVDATVRLRDRIFGAFDILENRLGLGMFSSLESGDANV